MVMVLLLLLLLLAHVLTAAVLVVVARRAVALAPTAGCSRRVGCEGRAIAGARATKR